MYEKNKGHHGGFGETVEHEHGFHSKVHGPAPLGVGTSTAKEPMQKAKSAAAGSTDAVAGKAKKAR